ncbi:MAG: helix-turn-helix transcriptional regulator [Proteobacteria bacterium]|nr:helix-turn-helix transcriptional regulator [Pseudomonadota bacterium]
MTAPESLAGALARLTDKELEILRLLTAGHTAKSIAARLGRSETSINERLREARRKTGIGSSRELARILDAQENRDKKIDLPPLAATPQADPRPESIGRQWSKGRRIMFIAIPAAAVGLASLAGLPARHTASPPARHATVARSTPLDGVWSLDVERIPPEERPRRVTITFHPAPGGKWATVVEMVAADGTASRTESIAAPDGVPVPVTGNMAFIDSGSLRQPAPNTLVMTLGKNGSPVSTRVYTVARDRRTMTETIIWAGSGIPKLETTTFRRIG